MTQPLRAGVIGGGVMGWNHARSLRLMPGVNLVGVVDVDESRRRRVETELGCAGYAETSSLYRAGVDAVVIASPNRLHLAHGVEAFEAGVHVLVEKPIASTVAEAHALIEAAARARKTLMVGHVERFNPAAVVARQACAGEEVVSIAITRAGPYPQRMLDVGVVLDIAVHDIDLIRMVADADIVSTHAQVASAHGRGEDAAFLQFQTGNGVIASINTNWLTPFRVREMRIATKSKFIVADLLARQVHVYSDYLPDGSYRLQQLGVAQTTDALRDEQAAFFDAVRTGRPPAVTGHDGLRSLEVALTCLGAVSPGGA